MPRYQSWMWRVGWILLTLVRPIVFRLRVEGRDNVPLVGGGVVVSNHNYGFDFIMLSYSSPRELHFMAKAEIFAWHPIVAWLMRSAGAFLFGAARVMPWRLRRRLPAYVRATSSPCSLKGRVARMGS